MNLGHVFAFHKQKSSVKDISMTHCVGQLTVTSYIEAILKSKHVRNSNFLRECLRLSVIIRN
jgi:hypothetical protein